MSIPSTRAARRAHEVKDAVADYRATIDALPPDVWTAVAVPHDYTDGTTHRWSVVYKTEGKVVQIADWLTEPVARMVAAAPDMLAELKSARTNFRQMAETFVAEWTHPLSESRQQTCERFAARIDAVIAKAEGLP